MRMTCDALGLQSHHFTPHSLRHGGATHAYSHLGQSIETIMHRGRWQSTQSCKTYLQAGRAQLLEQNIHQYIFLLAQQVESDWYPRICSLLFGQASL